MPTHHGLVSDVIFYTKKRRLFRYLKGEIKKFYYLYIEKLYYNVYYLVDNLLFFRFSPGRCLVKQYEQRFFGISDELVKIGNYYLDGQITYETKPVIYSLGVLTEISFDLAAADFYNTQIYMFDPAPIAKEYMAGVNNEDLNFYPIGVWIETKNIEFSCQKVKGRSPSMVIPHDGEKFVAQCKTLTDIKSELGHTKIDILKMDIEGAALFIFEDYLESGEILPSQIVVEFEANTRDSLQLSEFIVRVDKLITKMKNRGYQIFLIPREHNRYNSLEFLFSLRST